MRFNLKIMLILMLVAIIPISLTGIVSTLYYQDLIKKNIWNDNLAQAKAISIYTPAYIESARLYLESLSDRPLVVKAIEDKDTGFLDITAQYAVLEFKLLNMSPIFSEAYITDGDGVIISSYPYGSITGKKAMDKPFINNSIRSDTTVVSDAYISDVTGKPTVSIVVPIDSRIQGMKTVEDEKNVTVYGAIVGEINLDGFAMTVFRTQAINNQFIYMVNGTGHVMVHNRPEYMAEMKDFNSLTAVQRVLHGSEGVAEIYNPVERDWMLVAYSPIPEYGWGVVVSLPVGIAYKPIADATKYFIISIVALMAIALALAACIGNYFSRPILGMSRATAEMPGGGGGGDYRKYLPLERKDEIGELARSFDRMAMTIQRYSDAIIAERDRAEEEKSRAELCLDIMCHDANNFNQVAMGSLELLEGSEKLPGELKALASSARTAVEGSARLIDSVQKIQRVASGEYTKERLDISDMINEALREAYKPPDKKVEIRYSGQKGMVVEAASLLKEAFSNVINNAIKHSGPEVVVDISHREAMVDGRRCYEVSISDNGPGIPDDVKEKLFRRFQRGTTRALGKGLGLYITKMLVEMFGGKVWVEDRVPGDYSKGCRFVILLPAAEP